MRVTAEYGFYREDGEEFFTPCTDREIPDTDYYRNLITSGSITEIIEPVKPTKKGGE